MNYLTVPFNIDITDPTHKKTTSPRLQIQYTLRLRKSRHQLGSDTHYGTNTGRGCLRTMC